MARVVDASGNSPVGVYNTDKAVGQQYELQVVRPESEQVVAFAGAAVPTAAFDNTYQQVRLVASAACHYKIGPAAVATVNDNLLPASVVEYVKVRPGDVLSVIQSTAGGNLHIAKVS